MRAVVVLLKVEIALLELIYHLLRQKEEVSEIYKRYS